MSDWPGGKDANGFAVGKLPKSQCVGKSLGMLDLKDSDKEEECTRYIDQKYVAYIL